MSLTCFFSCLLVLLRLKERKSLKYLDYKLPFVSLEDVSTCEFFGRRNFSYLFAIVPIHTPNICHNLLNFLKNVFVYYKRIDPRGIESEGDEDHPQFESEFLLKTFFLCSL